MAMPSYTMRQLLEAGIHFGHTTRRWNPKMEPYIFGVRNGIHIIDLEQTMPMLQRGLEAIREVAAGGGRVLFVGTKRQATDIVSEAAIRCGQYFVNHRWLGGMLTNWKTISNSIKRLRDIEEQLAEEELGLTKKELLRLTRERDKLERALGGIKEMGSLPDILFVVDTNKEAIAVAEARKLGIPVMAVLDSNSDPDGIEFPVPGNDDAMRAINLYCGLVSGAVLDGLEAELMGSGADIGESEDGPLESVLVEAVGETVGQPAAEPDSKQEEPEVKTEAPEAKAEEPDTKAEEPEAKTEAPETKTEAPETKTEAPETKAEAPEAKAEEPEAKAEEPEAKTEAPEAKAEAPEAKAEKPAESS